MADQESSAQGKLRQRKGRVILRNLVFDVNPKILKSLCAKYGEIIDVG